MDHPTTFSVSEQAARQLLSIMARTGSISSSHSHSFNHGRQRKLAKSGSDHFSLSLLAVSVLIIFHSANCQHHSISNHHVGQLPSARRPLAILPPSSNNVHPQVSPPPPCSRLRR